MSSVIANKDMFIELSLEIVGFNEYYFFEDNKILKKFLLFNQKKKASHE